GSAHDATLRSALPEPGGLASVAADAARAARRGDRPSTAAGGVQAAGGQPLGRCAIFACAGALGAQSIRATDRSTGGLAADASLDGIWVVASTGRRAVEIVVILSLAGRDARQPVVIASVQTHRHRLGLCLRDRADSTAAERN